MKLLMALAVLVAALTTSTAVDSNGRAKRQYFDYSSGRYVATYGPRGEVPAERFIQGDIFPGSASYDAPIALLPPQYVGFAVPTAGSKFNPESALAAAAAAARFEDKFTEGRRLPLIQTSEAPQEIGVPELKEKAGEDVGRETADGGAANVVRHERGGGWWKALTDWWFPRKPANPPEPKERQQENRNGGTWFPFLTKLRDSWLEGQDFRRNRIVVVEVNVNSPKGGHDSSSSSTTHSPPTRW